jgi:hypothetical protein
MHLYLYLSFFFLLSSFQLGCYPDRDAIETDPQTDTGHTNGTPDEAISDAGNTDGASDGSTVDAGSSEGTGEGNTVDAGSSEGTIDGNMMDAGSFEGASDGNTMDAGSSEGTSDGNMMDAGSSEGTSDGTNVDSGNNANTSCSEGDYMLSTAECAPCPENTYQPSNNNMSDITACLTCNEGYSSMSGAANCNDINECTNNTHDCHDDATCTNENGNFNCACGFGYIGNGQVCEPVENCVEGQYVSTAGTSTTNPVCVSCPGFEPTLLSENMCSGGNVNFSFFRIDPTSMNVAYHADATEDNFENIYTVPISGGTPLIADHRTSESHYNVSGQYRWTPDGSFLLYQDIFGSGLRTYKVEPGSSNSPLLLGPNAPESVYYKLNSEGTHIVYNNGNGALYAAPLSGEDAIMLGNELSTNTDEDFQISPDGQTVVYRVQSNDSHQTRIFAVDINGTTAPIELSNFDTSIILSTINHFTISPDGGSVVFTFQKDSNNWDELYSIPIGGGVPTRLNSDFSGPPNTPDITFQISPNSEKVVYLADQNNSGARDLYAVPIDGSSAALKINDAIVPGGEINDEFQIDQEATLVLYRGDITTDGNTNLYVSATSGLGSMPMVVPLCNGCQVTDFKMHLETNKVLYRVANENGDFNLFLVDNGAANGLRVNSELEAGASVFYDYRFSNEGISIFYSAQQEVSTRRDLHVYFIDQSTYRRINEPYASNSIIWLWDVSPDSKKVVYIIGPVTAANTRHLHSAFVEGGTFSNTLNQDMCLPWTICNENEYLVEQGTSSSDQTCGPCDSDHVPGITNATQCLP